MTLIELVVVLAVIGAMLVIGASNLSEWSENQRLATSARSIADAFSLARAEAIRTGDNHIVAFDIETGLAGINSDVVIVDDGPPGNTSGVSSNCRIDDGGIVHRVSLEPGVSFGTDPALANGTPAPHDSGASGNQATGSSFTTAAGADASWVMFQSDGLPRRFTQNGSTNPCPTANVGAIGQAGGAIYVTNGKRDYAIVMTPLGTVRMHRWRSGSWTP
jgi:type II secretory pathway pseudopilin PulG